MKRLATAAAEHRQEVDMIEDSCGIIHTRKMTVNLLMRNATIQPKLSSIKSRSQSTKESQPHVLTPYLLFVVSDTIDRLAANLTLRDLVS
jgi:hypothetical protein